ncbi:unnamed protein product, partial [Discosporangium mesarthrocarpum]
MFPTKNLGELKWYTGCAFTRDRQAGKIKVTQTAYIYRICERFQSSLQTLSRLSQKFRALIGVLLWVANMTRPDIANSVRALARHMLAPSKTHWKAGLRVLKFLRKTRDWGVTFQKTGQMRLYAYADSSYG